MHVYLCDVWCGVVASNAVLRDAGPSGRRACLSGGLVPRTAGRGDVVIAASFVVDSLDHGGRAHVSLMPRSLARACPPFASGSVFTISAKDLCPPGFVM